MLSGTAEYALRAVVWLARQPDDQSVRASDLAESIGVPRNYLGKILHDLVRAGILESARGKNGGFRLATPPEELTLLRVVSSFDTIGVGAERRCLMGRPECDSSDPCPVHRRWQNASEAISRFFEETTVGDVLSDDRREGRSQADCRW
ncbi:MAG: Rrf2 family transcriptional regulator [Gemmatimonadota bacterium]|nr:MAG: Rrf2 family transcriptional regulator [Gemmatimonadota bacterium]